MFGLKERKRVDEKPFNAVKHDLKTMNKKDVTGRATLCYIFKHDKVLLQLKNIKKFGGGKWNAPGGKLKEGETPEEGVIREVFEETGLQIKKPNLRGKIFFVFAENGEYNQEVYIFYANSFSGKEKANEEGELKWFGQNSIPIEKMWPDDKYWLPIFLQGKKFTAKFYFDSYGSQKITKYEINEGL